MARPNPFVQAVDQVIEQLRETEDNKSRFYQELLKEAAKLRYHDGTYEQSSISAQALQSFIESLDEKQTRHGKTRWIGRKLQPLIAGLMQFTHAMDTMIQAGPAPAMLIYGGAKLVLSLAADFAECFDKMVDAMHEIGTMLKCYHVFSVTYDSADLMRPVLVDSYKNILLFWQQAAKIFTRNGVKVFIKGVVKPFDSIWKTLRDNLRLDVMKVSTMAQALEGDAARRREQEARLRASTQDRSLQQIRDQQIRAWLSGPDDINQIDVRMDLEPIQKARHVGTCRWIFDDLDYRQWLTSTESENLWLYASPGTGKSVLCSTIIEQLQHENKKVVYFFFSFQEAVRRNITSALKCIALPLLGLHGTVPTDIERIFEHEHRHGHTRLQNHNVVVKVIQALLKSLDRVHIVLDGLDECEQREHALELLRECFSTSTYGIVKWLWASRLEPDFQSLSSHVNARSVYIDKCRVEADIKKFIEDNPGMAGSSDDSINEWVSAASGNFLWLTLMLRILTGCDLTCPAEVEEELDKFPKDLTQCYQRALDQLAKRSKSQQELVLAKKLFLLVAFAEQPLTLHEILDALSIDEASGAILSKRRPYETTIRKLCCPLILLDPVIVGGRHELVLRYFHKSIRDFFLEDPERLDISDANRAFFTTPEQGQLSMSRMCMTYLSDKRYREPAFIDPDDKTFVDDHGFMRYAALFWHRHFSHAGYSDSLFGLTQTFVRSMNFWSCVRVQATIAPYLFGRLISEDDERFSVVKPSHVDATDRDYFATPLPDWLGNSDEGCLILQAYLSLIREWNPVLLLQPQAALQCNPGILGSQNIFAAKGCEHPNDHIMYLKPGSKSAHQCKAAPGSIFHTYILGTQPTKSGIRLFSVERSLGRPLATHVLTQWHANLDDRSLYHGIEIKQKQMWEFRTLTRVPLLQLRSAEKIHEPTVWSFEPETLSLSVDRDGQDLHFAAPSSIRQPWIGTPAIMSLDERRSRVELRQYHDGHRLVICAIWKYGSQATGSETDDSDTDDSDSDISDIESNASGNGSTSRAGAQHKSDRQDCIVLIIVIEGSNEPIWSSLRSPSRFVGDSIPGHDLKNSLMVWPISDSLVQCVCLTTQKSQHLSIPSVTRGEILLRDLQFSKCGTILYCLTVTLIKDPGGKQCTTYSVSLEKFIPRFSDAGIFTLAEFGVKPTPICVTYTTRRTASQGTFLRSWNDGWVCVAINSSSCLCAVKVIRLPLSDTPPAGSPAAQALPEIVYVPSSFATRSPRLDVLHTSTDERIVFVLQSSAASRCVDLGSTETVRDGADPTKESTVSSEEPTSTPLPPIMITRLTNQLGGWQIWDAERDGKEPGVGDDSNVEDYVKGCYAAADQRFEVPIRSGLNCRRAITVSCW